MSFEKFELRMEGVVGRCIKKEKIPIGEVALWRTVKLPKIIYVICEEKPILSSYYSKTFDKTNRYIVRAYMYQLDSEAQFYEFVKLV